MLIKDEDSFVYTTAYNEAVNIIESLGVGEATNLADMLELGVRQGIGSADGAEELRGWRDAIADYLSRAKAA
ncbi:MAG: hypothetical protein B7X02_02520 [Rhodospirillales bacterium 12-54-5]|nr:MAG: hypothetical protein B7X02_02520 [Rhodospirillales bacterium 12-54-5]